MDTALHQLLFQIHSNSLQLTSTSTEMINKFIDQFLIIFIRKSLENDYKIPEQKDFSQVTFQLLSKSLATHVISEATKRILLYQEQHGLINLDDNITVLFDYDDSLLNKWWKLPIPHICNKITHSLENDDINWSVEVSLFLVGVIEHLCSDLLELCGHEAIKDNKTKITPTHLRKGITHDKSLQILIESMPTNPFIRSKENKLSTSCKENKDLNQINDNEKLSKNIDNIKTETLIEPFESLTLNSPEYQSYLLGVNQIDKLVTILKQELQNNQSPQNSSQVRKYVAEIRGIADSMLSLNKLS